MVVEQQYISAQVFWELLQEPEYADKSWELVNGEMVEIVDMPGWDHGVITLRIGRLIGNHVEEKQLGYVTAAETTYILKENPDGKDTVRKLDVGFVSKARAPQGVRPGPVPFGPDLAVEVISPGNSAEDIHNKVLELLEAGTKIIWVVYPDSQTVLQFTPDDIKMFKGSDTLNGGDVLPQFELPVREIFAI